MIPLPADGAQETIERAKRFWSGDNPIQILVPADMKTQSKFEFRVPADLPVPTEEPKPLPPKTTPPASEDGSRASLDRETNLYRTATLVLQESAAKTPPEIRVEVTPNGILLFCDDEEALDRFENLLRKLYET